MEIKVESSLYGKMLHVPQSVAEAVKYLRDLGKSVTAVTMLRDLVMVQYEVSLHEARNFSIEIQKERRVASYRSDAIKYEIFRIDS